MFRMSMAARVAPRHPLAAGHSLRNGPSVADCDAPSDAAAASAFKTMPMSCFPSLLVGGAVVTDVAAASKDAVLRELATRLAVMHDLDAATVLDGLRAREALGSTGVGCGVAIPHARSAAVTAPVGMLLRLSRPIDFDSVDAAPVDLVFGLVTPASCGQEHLQALACAARTLRDPALASSLRAAPTQEALAELALSSLRANGA